MDKDIANLLIEKLSENSMLQYQVDASNERGVVLEKPPTVALEIAKSNFTGTPK